MMREVTPIDRALLILDEFEKQILHLKAELSAYLPNDEHPVQDWITDPLTKKRLYFTRQKL